MPDNDKKFDIDFKLIPPNLQMQLWVLGLDANTSRVNIAYKSGGFLTSLAYNYGGNIEAALSIRNVSTKVGVNPSSGAVDLGLVYRGFRFGTTADFTQSAFGFNFGYGATLLPFPWELSTTFNSAALGLQNMTSDISAAPDNPLAWYRLHSNDISAVGKAVSLGQQINKYGDKSNRFGVGMRLNYAPQTGLTIYGGAMFMF